MNIRVDLNYPIQDGTEVVFRSPVDCSQVTGLKVYYQDAYQEFMFADAHGNNVGDIDHLFAEDVVVKVILDVTKGMAFVQNADTNAYIESTFIKTVNGVRPDENGNVNVAGGGGAVIDDEDISAYKTWSSQKISDTIAEQGGGDGNYMTWDDYFSTVYEDIRWAVTTPEEEGGVSESVVDVVINSEEITGTIQSALEYAILTPEEEGGMQERFAEAVLAVLPIYDGEVVE